MSAADSVTPEPRRFSIRLPRPLWMGVAAVVLMVVGVGQFALPIYREQVAIREIERLGGEIFQTRPRGPIWLTERLRTVLGKRFDAAVGVRLSRTEATDATLNQLGCLVDLELLFLADTQVTDTGLAHLTRLINLQVLDLTNTQSGDVGLAHLKRLTNLRILKFNNTRVTDVGLAHLKGISLRDLEIGDTRVTDAGLESLMGLKDMESLNLRNTQVTGDGVAKLMQALPGLSVCTSPSVDLKALRYSE